MREALLEAAIRRFETDGYEGATMASIAADVGVSPGLLYKYFDGKQALVLELYARRSAELAARFEEVPAGTWAGRALATMRLALEVLGPNRETLRAVLPALLVDAEAGLLSRAAYGPREQVRSCFVQCVRGASDAAPDPEVLGRLLYLLQLAVLLWWVLDRSERQQSTDGLLQLLEAWLPSAGMLLWLPGTSAVLRQIDGLAAALYDDPPG